MLNDCQSGYHRRISASISYLMQQFLLNHKESMKYTKPFIREVQPDNNLFYFKINNKEEKTNENIRGFACGNHKS
jgi:hypothetical protein